MRSDSFRKGGHVTAIAANDNFQLISLKDTCALTSMSKTMILRLRRDGSFPQPVELGEKRIAFVRSEVLAWIQQKLASRAS